MLASIVVIKLGYACLTLGMPEPSMRAAQLGRFRRGLVDLRPIYEYNADYARRSIVHSALRGLTAHRLSSDMFPLLDLTPDMRALVPDLGHVRHAARRAGVHLSAHPSQFVVLSTPHEAVTTTFGLASSIRDRSSFGAKPPNTTEWMAPSRAQASMAISVSGTMGM